MTGLLRVLRKTLDAIYLLCGALAGIFMVVICTLMMVMSIGREIGVNLRGGDEMASWLTAATAFLGLAYTLRAGEMIRVGLVIERFEGRMRRRCELAALTVSVLFVGAFAAYACQMVWDSYRFNEYSQGALAVPIWIPQFGMVAGIVVLFVSFMDELVRVAIGRKPSYEKEPPKTAEEVIARAVQSGV